jgi:tRNA-(ms[2]io[6]A)-hydroxylase
LDGLPLRYATPPEWARVAVSDLDGLLSDHAHCEQKAASMAIALIGRFPEAPNLAREMIALAQEEMRHFRQVLDLIESRGGSLGRPLPDPYVRALREWGFRHRGGFGALGDLLLVSAFVEARSCERFRLLAAELRGEDLGVFYSRLAEAEARHWETFRDLCSGSGKRAIGERIAEMAEAEAEIVRARPLEARMH